MNGGGDENADGEDWLPMTIDDTPKTPIRHFQLEGLEPDQRYKLTVRAQNDLGWSNYSSEFVFRTAPGIDQYDLRCMLSARTTENNRLYLSLISVSLH